MTITLLSWFSCLKSKGGQVPSKSSNRKEKTKPHYKKRNCPFANQRYETLAQVLTRSDYKVDAGPSALVGWKIWIMYDTPFEQADTKN